MCLLIDRRWFQSSRMREKDPLDSSATSSPRVVLLASPLGTWPHVVVDIILNGQVGHSLTEVADSKCKLTPACLIVIVVNTKHVVNALSFDTHTHMHQKPARTPSCTFLFLITFSFSLPPIVKFGILPNLHGHWGLLPLEVHLISLLRKMESSRTPLWWKKDDSGGLGSHLGGYEDVYLTLWTSDLFVECSCMSKLNWLHLFFSRVAGRV